MQSLHIYIYSLGRQLTKRRPIANAEIYMHTHIHTIPKLDIHVKTHKLEAKKKKKGKKKTPSAQGYIRPKRLSSKIETHARLRNQKLAAQIRLPLVLLQLSQDDVARIRPVLKRLLDVDDDYLEALQRGR